MATNLPDDPQDFLRLVLKHLGSFQEEIGQYDSRDSLFSQKVASEIRQIKSILSQTISHLQEDFENLNGGADPIEFLLALGHLRHSFEGIQQQIFRNSALSLQPTSATQYDIIATQQYPIYISQFPALPAGTNTCQIRISINAQEHFDRIVPLTTLASDFIFTTVKELSLSFRPESTICKAIGLNEYVYGEKSLSNYQCVREAVRKRRILHFSLIQRQGLDLNAVERIISLGKQLQKEFLERAGRVVNVEDLVIEDADDDGDFDLDLDAIQFQRLQQVQNNKEHSLIGAGNLLHHFDDSDDEELGFSRTAEYKSTRSKLILSEASITASTSRHISPHPSSQLYATPSKQRKLSLLAGRDRTPSPDATINRKLHNKNIPDEEEDEVKIVPLGRALQTRIGDFDPSEYHLDEDYLNTKRTSSIMEVPDIFKRSPGVGSRLAPLGFLDNISDAEELSPYPNQQSFFTQSAAPLVSPADNGRRSISRTHSVSKEKEEPQHEDLRVGAYGFQEEINQRRLLASRQTHHQRTNSRQLVLNDSDEEEFAALAKKTASPTAGDAIGNTADNMTDNTAQTEAQTEAPTSDEGMFLGAARSPNKRMATRSSQTSTTINTPDIPSLSSQSFSKNSNSHSQIKPIESETSLPSIAAAAAAVPAEESMFGGASSRPNRRMAAPRQRISTTPQQNTTLDIPTPLDGPLPPPPIPPSIPPVPIEPPLVPPTPIELPLVPPVPPPVPPVPPTPIEPIELPLVPPVPIEPPLVPPVPVELPSADRQPQDEQKPLVQKKKSTPPPLLLNINSISSNIPNAQPSPSSSYGAVPNIMLTGTPRNADRVSFSRQNSGSNSERTSFSTNQAPLPIAGGIASNGAVIPPPPSKSKKSTPQSTPLTAPLSSPPNDFTLSTSTTPIQHSTSLPVPNLTLSNSLEHSTHCDESREEGDIISPLNDFMPMTTRQASRSISSATTPEQLLAQAASKNLTTASPNFFMASNKAPTAPQSSTASTGNRRSSLATFGAMGGSSAANKGSLFRFQNSTFTPENLAELSNAAQDQITSLRGSFSVPQLSQFKTDIYREQIDYDDDAPLTLDGKSSTISSQETHLPNFRLNIVGVDGVNFASCPRLAHYSGYSKLYVAACLVHGEVIRAESVASTREVDPSFAPRWNEIILPTARPITYGSILRESKVAFVLIARFTNNKTTEKTSDQSFDSKDNKDVRDVPIAWVSEQIFLETNQMLSGRHHFELWPIGSGDPDDDSDITSSLGASQVIVETTHEKRIVPPTSVVLDKKDKKDKKKDKEKQKHQLEMGRMNPNLTKGVDLQLQQYIFRGANCANFLTQEPAVLTVEFDSFSAPIVTPLESQGPSSPVQYHDNAVRALSTLTRDEVFRVTVLSTEDALYTLTDEDKQLIWNAREKVRSMPHMMVKFAQSVNWSDHDQRWEAQSLLRRWADLTSPAQIIAMLDQPIQDYEVRKFAVDRLKRFSLGHIQQYLLQLTQCLKFEPYHNSPLSRFLLQIAIQYPSQIGTYYYWNLKNEMCCDPPFTLRFAALLEAFLTFCPQATEQLRAQQQIIDECKRIALTIQRKKATSTDAELDSLYRDQVTSFNRDFLQRVPKFQLPLDSRWEATGLIPEKCKIMSSKMAPLWLVFQNADPAGDNLYLIFKAGDDLRQDMLTLQILRFMDELWLENGLDLRLSPYNVVATGMTEDGRGCGMIEVVLNSQTTAGIQRAYGGGASGAFQEDTIWRFLLEHNKTSESIQRATDNFLRSCAGYCVATYILGIGDRHNGNIMVTKDGHLFHIDFGHFLGNFKSKMGINRERAAFVCTPEMIYAACGGSNDQSSQQFDQFNRLCQDAFIYIRQHASELETLFISMVSAGMPECLSKQAILYIRQKLSLEQTETQARATFKAELLKAVNSTSRKIDNFIHLVKHSSKA